jgi:membrane associated rhomboid family serine protease
MSYYRVPPQRPTGPQGFIGLPSVTPANRGIMIACGAVWLVQVVLGPVLRLVDLSTYFGIVPLAVAHGWVWQPLTYLFLHAPTHPMHILLNMLMLWMIGGELERYWGAKRYVTYYLVCGVGAGLFVTALGLARAPEIPTIGASGAIYGLFLAYGMLFSERIIYFMMVFPIRARTMSWILFAIAFLSNWTQGADGVSHIAHLGGMVIGWLYLKKAWHLPNLWREVRWRVRRRRFKVMPPGDEDRWVN